MNGERCLRARLPKVGPAPEQRKFYQTTSPSSGQEYFAGTNTFQVRPGVIDPNWRNMQDVECVLLHYWIEDRLPIQRFDAETNTVMSARTSGMTIKKGTYFYIENVFEALSEPGEWYLDRLAGRLWYVPRPGEKLNEIEAYAPRIKQLLKVTGVPEQQQFVSGLRFEGLTFEHAEWDRPGETIGAWSVQAASTAPAVVYLYGARNCAIHHCTIQHVGFYGIELASGCKNIEITHNELQDLGAGGIKQNGANIADNPEAPGVTGRNIITDNHIHHAGRVFHSGVGILSQNAFENDISHNHIHDLFYSGISCGWVWGYGSSVSANNRIEKNHIHDLGFGWLSDMGGIYTLSMQPGTVLRGNLIYNVFQAGYGAWGIYLDEGSSNVLVENNICYNFGSNPFHQHYGRNNMLRNNIFAFGREGQVRLSKPEGMDLAFTCERNVILTKNLPIYVGNGITAIISNNIKADNNLFYDYKGKSPKFAWTGQNSLTVWQTSGLDAHSVVADPGFVDAENGDFQLKPNSPALALGFVPIDMSDVGPRPLVT